MISIVTIYEHPDDFPDSFVARRFYGEFATNDFKIAPSIDPLRAWAKAQVEQRNRSQGVNLGRDPKDDPKIVESWI